LVQLLNYCQYSGLLSEFALGPEPGPHPASMTTPVRGFENALPTMAIAEVVSLAKRCLFAKAMATNLRSTSGAKQ